MKRMKPQKQLLQFVMLALLSVVSVLVTSNESYAALDCTQCHGTVGSNRPLDTTYAAPASYRNITTGAFKGSHVKHLGGTPLVTDCAVCHTGAGAYGPAHRDGNIQVSAGVAYLKGTSFPQTATPTPLTTCTTACHSSTSTTVGIATPVWGTQADCSSCHEVSPTTVSHTKHLTGTVYTKAVCIDCHSNTVQGVSTEPNHVNNSILVTGYTGGAKTKGSPVSTCTTTYCHSSGQGATALVATPVYSPVTWGGTVTCGSCHATTGMTTGSHTAHIAMDSNCANCHTGATATTYVSAAHLDKDIDVAAGVGYTLAGPAGNGYGTCSAAACHSPFLGGTPNVVPTWGGGVDCESCHAQTPTTGAHSEHFAVAAIGFSCSKCHTSSSAATHANGFTNVSGSLGRLIAAPVAKHASDAYTATCTTVCHSAFTTAGTTPNWGAQADCTTCHTANTGAHTAHITSAAVIAAATGGLAANSCGVCHAGSTTTAFGAGHANNLVNVTQVSGGTTPKHAANAYTATCATSCHNPLSTTLTVATPNWGTPITDCTTCHTSGFTAGTGATTGSHDAHRLAGSACTSCHAGATATTKPTAGHFDGNIDAAAYATQDKLKGSLATTCSTASCHANVYGTGTTTTPVWGTTADCKACHLNAVTNDFAAGPATGSHVSHMDSTYGTYTGISCANCHTTPGSGATHNDNSVNVIQYAGGPVAKHTAGTYLANGCATSTCHQGALVAPAPAATWGATTGCNTCHAFPPATATHPASPDGNCNSCHSDVTAGTWTAAQAAAGSVTFADPTKHMDGALLGGSCNSCHGYPPVQADKLSALVNYSGGKMENYSGGGGVHTVAGHLSPFVRPGTSFAGCVTCHPSTLHNGGAGTFKVANVDIAIPNAYRFNADLPIKYERTGGAGSKTTGKCSNVSCHFKITPTWTDKPFTTGH